jgi:hypothetical protein
LAGASSAQATPNPSYCPNKTISEPNPNYCPEIIEEIAIPWCGVIGTYYEVIGPVSPGDYMSECTYSTFGTLPFTLPVLPTSLKKYLAKTLGTNLAYAGGAPTYYPEFAATTYCPNPTICEPNPKYCPKQYLC